MNFNPQIEVKIENFDECWAFGDPKIIEKKFNELLPQAEKLEDKSFFLQIMSQIALTQALQKRFEDAHKTLDQAENLLTDSYKFAKARILLERGRIFHQAEKYPEAKILFNKSFEFSIQQKFDYQAIDAAHMIAILAETPEEKILWNQRALHMAETTADEKARMWKGSLWNNLGQNYLEKKDFEGALHAFKQALDCRVKEGYNPNIRIAKWAIAHTLRLLNQLESSLSILELLVKEYNSMAEKGSYDMPIDVFKLAQGWIYEDLAEIYNEFTKKYSSLAFDCLSNDEMFSKTEPARLERLKQLST